MNIRIFKGFAGLTPCCLSVVSDSVFRITSDLSAGGLMLPKCWIQMKGRCDDLHWLDSGGSQVSHLLPAHSGGIRTPAGRKESICWRFGSSNCQKSRWTCLHWAVYRSKCITCHADRVKDFSSVCSDIPFIGESERALFAGAPELSAVCRLNILSKMEDSVRRYEEQWSLAMCVCCCFRTLDSSFHGQEGQHRWNPPGED